MSFAQPWMLFGLLAAAVPILIHLIFRRRPRRQPFPAIELLLRSAQRVERRWRIRRWLLLASRVAVLSLFVLAASRPMFPEEAPTAQAVSGPERLALVLDRSLSMRAEYDGGTAFEQARRLALRAIDRMGPADVAALVVTGPAPRVILEPTADVRALRRAVERLEPSYAATDLGPAVTLAARIVTPEPETSSAADDGSESGPGLRVLVLSDFGRGSLTAPADSTGTEVEWVQVPPADADRSNVALLSVRAESVPGHRPRTLRFVSRVRSFGDVEGSLPLDLWADGETRVKTRVDVTAGAVGDKTVEHQFDAPGSVPVRVALAPDRLPEDDAHYLVARVRRQVRSLVVDGAPSGIPKQDEVFYLENALRVGADDQPPPRTITVDELAEVDLSQVDVVWLAGVPFLPPGQGERLVRFVRAGGGLALTAADGLATDLYNQELGEVLPRPLRGIKAIRPDLVGSPDSLRFAEPDLDHPILGLFRGEALNGLLSTRVDGVLLTEPTGGGQVPLAYRDGQPAMLVHEAGRGRVLVWTTSVDRDLTDFPIRPAFLPWVRRSLLWLGDALFETDRRSTRVGEARRLELPPDARRAWVARPDGSTVEVAPGSPFEDTDLPGHYRVRVDVGSGPVDLSEEDFGVNVDPTESDLQSMDPAQVQALLQGDGVGGRAGPSSRLEASTGLDPERIMASLLLAMLAMLLLESLLSARRLGRPG